MEALLPHFTGFRTIQFCSFVTFITYDIVLLYHKRYFPFCELMYVTDRHFFESRLWELQLASWTARKAKSFSRRQKGLTLGKKVPQGVW